MNYVSDTHGTAQGASLLAPRLTERGFDIGDLLRVFWRRRSLFIGTVVLLMALAVAGLFAVTPSYTAQTDVIIESREQKFADLTAVLGDVMPDKEGLLSEIEVIRSRRIAEKVIDALRLGQDPEFNEAVKPKGVLATLLVDAKDALSEFLPADILAPFLASRDAKTSEQDLLAREREKTIDEFLDRLDVTVKGLSRVIVIYFRSESPEKAARIANAVADTYIVEQLEAKFEATQRANKWLAGKLQDLRKQVAQSEGAVEAFRRQAGLLQSSKDGTLISQQVTDLNTQLIVARSERAAAEARLDQVRQMIRAAGNAQAAADVLGSPTIQDLSKQESEIKRKLADLSQEMGDRHPRLISARAELKDLDAKMASEVNKVVQKLENEAAVARAREATIMRSAQQLENRLGQANASEVQLRALEREADANKALLQQFLSRFEEISAQSDLVAQQTNARVLSRAIAPEHPSEPKKVQILALVFVAATAIAAALVLMVENLDRGFRSGEQIEQNTGVRSLGLVPIFKGRRRDGSPQAYVAKNPSSQFGESIRSVYTSILISHAKPAPRTVLITSSQPKEGKTTLATCLTRICAISGKRAVIIEADLRKPSVHRAFGIPQTPGVTDYVRNEAPLADVLHLDQATGAYVVPAGRLGVDPTQVLASAEMRRLISELSRDFDLVVIDSPPLMAVSDARQLAPDVDATVYVVRWGKTDREVARLGLKELAESGANLGGVVLSMVDPDKHARYGFGDSGYYYKGVRSYYTT